MVCEGLFEALADIAGLHHPCYEGWWRGGESCSSCAMLCPDWPQSWPHELSCWVHWYTGTLAHGLGSTHCALLAAMLGMTQWNKIWVWQPIFLSRFPGCDGLELGWAPLARAGGVQPGATLPCLSSASEQPPRVDITCHSWLQLATACYSWVQLVTAGLNLLQLVTACHSWLQLVTAGYSWLQVMTCCQSLLTVCVGRVAGVWVGGVHAGVTGHMSLVCILYLLCI